MFKKILWSLRCTAYYEYRWQIMVGSINSEFGAVASTAIVIAFNLFNLNLMLKIIFGVPFIFSDLNKLELVIIAVLILYFNYLYLMARGRFDKIKKEFGDASETQNQRRKYFTIIYTISTFILFITLLIKLKSH